VAVSLPPIAWSTYINAPVETVYSVLTTEKGWNSWFTTDCKIDLRPGGNIEFVWRNWALNHMDFEDGGTILEVVENQKFSFTWHREFNPTTVTFNLNRLGEGTVLQLTDSGYDSQAMGPDLSGFAGCSVGWGELVTLLKVFIEHGITYGDVPKAS
jgi:uncharacterized protein YndB with AHSA1/START domain